MNTLVVLPAWKFRICKIEGSRREELQRTLELFLNSSILIVRDIHFTYYKKKIILHTSSIFDN